MSRPTVMTDEVVSKLEHAFSMGCTDLEACMYAGIAKATFYRYQEDNEDFRDHSDGSMAPTIVQLIPYTVDEDAHSEH